jgi:hypothetical protein
MRTGAALACTAVLALAACGSDDDSGSGSSPTATDAASTASTTGASPTTGAAGGTPAPGGDAPAPGDSAGSGGDGQVSDDARCHTSELEVTDGGGDGAAGSVYHTLNFRNSGDRTCTVAGFPGVSLVGDDNGTQIGAAADRESGGAADPVTLGPGQSATAQLRIVNVDNYGDQCTVAPADGLRIYPPDELDSTYLPMSGLRGCTNDDIVALHIGALQPA